MYKTNYQKHFVVIVKITVKIPFTSNIIILCYAMLQPTLVHFKVSTDNILHGSSNNWTSLLALYDRQRNRRSILSTEALKGLH